MVYDEADAVGLQLLELHDHSQQPLNRLVEDLQLPVDVVAALDEGSYLPFGLKDKAVGLVLGERGEGGEGEPADAAESVRQFVHEGDGREQQVGEGLVEIVEQLLVVLPAVLVEDAVEDVPGELGEVLVFEVVGEGVHHLDLELP